MSRAANIALGLAFIGITLFVAIITFSRTGSPSYAAKVDRDSLRVEAVKKAVAAIHKFSYPNESKVRKKEAPEQLFPGAISEYQYKSWVDPLTREHYGYKKVSPNSFEFTVTFELPSADLEKRGIRMEHEHLAHKAGQHTMRFTTEDSFSAYSYWEGW